MSNPGVASRDIR
jgi:hypothetical protein